MEDFPTRGLNLASLLLHCVCSPAAENVYGRCPGIAPHDPRDLQLPGINLLLFIQQGIHKNKAQCLGFSTIDQTAYKADVLLRQFRVDLFPDSQSPFAHLHGAPLLCPSDQPSQFLLQESELILQYGRKQRNQLAPESDTVLLQQMWLPEQATVEKLSAFLQSFVLLTGFWEKRFLGLDGELMESEQPFYIKV